MIGLTLCSTGCSRTLVPSTRTRPVGTEHLTTDRFADRLSRKAPHRPWPRKDRFGIHRVVEVRKIPGKSWGQVRNRISENGENRRWGAPPNYDLLKELNVLYYAARYMHALCRKQCNTVSAAACQGDRAGQRDLRITKKFLRNMFK